MSHGRTRGDFLICKLIGRAPSLGFLLMSDIIYSFSEPPAWLVATMKRQLQEKFERSGHDGNTVESGVKWK